MIRNLTIERRNQGIHFSPPDENKKKTLRLSGESFAVVSVDGSG